MLETLDLRDLLFAVAGLAFVGLTFLPLVCGKRLISVPMIYVSAGVLLALSPLGWPIIDPRGSETHLAIVEHATEIIVIVALATAGLAVDTRAGRETWQHAWMLLAVTMPLTILAMFLLGQWAGLGLGAAILLGGAMAPTDPVLARDVQVGGPTEGGEDDVRLSLTTESGLNDALAFPFIWLAIVVVEAGNVLTGHVLRDWVLRDVLWRISSAMVLAVIVGWLIGKYSLGSYGDLATGGHNAGLLFLGSTFFVYGVTEAVDGYGFLAVFVAARVGRWVGHRTDAEDYVLKPHAAGEQFEKILLAVLLLWLGSFAAAGGLEGLRFIEVIVALLLIFVIRPAAGWVALFLTRGTHLEKVTIAFFGIRGMGSLFYIAYGASHAQFADIDTVWRIAIVAVLISIIVHGVLAPIAMSQVSERSREPAKQGS
ncbi:cation:proton antiporter [Yoonia litorea]|uniref:Sodium/proton antiporter, CPA1 family n=1 Tax=Yoonia litorea TaxID=1123755 RepID=A0A1I6N065_9RHOB|nr:cation:proton antiporter [Yoonia litorea]SFS21178.1 sodium/proton antiporter, CPA1 family [Yoonia litorea]